MRWRVRPARVEGTARVPGDKSIAHRAYMLAALASGRSVLRNTPAGQDVRSTRSCLEKLGVSVEEQGEARTVLSMGRLVPPAEDLYAGNSGTTMRLLTGILAAQPFNSCISGDESLSRRPMRRIIEPLETMGADIRSRDGRAPLDIQGRQLKGVRYRMPLASAQVKSSILLAGLFAEGTTTVIEPAPTRDHTERMLRALGVSVRETAGTVEVDGGRRPRPFEICIPGDPSSAAFLFAAAVLTGGAVTIRDLGLNPSRIAFLGVLKRMGATVEFQDERLELGEPVGSVTVHGSVDTPAKLEAAEIPSLIDELPLVALLATRCRGETIVREAGELRVKETDRIAAVVQELGRLGADIRELPDGFAVRGPSPLNGNEVVSHHDHRIAMMLAVAGSAARGEVTIDGAEAATISYPEFVQTLTSLGGDIHAA